MPLNCIGFDEQDRTWSTTIETSLEEESEGKKKKNKNNNHNPSLSSTTIITLGLLQSSQYNDTM